MTFLDVWLGYAVFGTIVFSIIFVWAVRARQFSDLDRGRYIPLDGDRTTSSEDEPCRRRSRVDLWGVALVVCIAGVLMLTAVVLGIRSG